MNALKIDFHYHLAEKPGYVENLLQEMEQAGVERTLLMGGPSEAYWEYMGCNFASNEKNPGRGVK